MTGDRHRETPVAVRFSEDRQRLEDFAREHGKAVHRVIRDAVRAWLDKHASPLRDASEAGTANRAISTALETAARETTQAGPGTGETR